VPANHAIPARRGAKHITLQPRSSDGFYLHPCTVPLYCTLYCFSHYSLVEGTQPSLQNELSSFNTTPRSQVYALDVRSEALASPPHLLSQTFPTATDIRHPCRCCPRRVTGFKRKTPTAWVSSRGGVGRYQQKKISASTTETQCVGVRSFVLIYPPPQRTPF